MAAPGALASQAGISSRVASGRPSSAMAWWWRGGAIAPLREGRLQDVDQARIGERRIDRGAVEEAHGRVPAEGSAVDRERAGRAGESLAVALARQAVGLGLPALGLGGAPARGAPPARLRHPRREPADHDADQQRAEQIDVERQHQRQHRLVGPERIEHQAHAVAVDDGQRDQDDRRRQRQQVFQTTRRSI